MSGHGFYAVLGGGMFLIGLALLVRLRRSRGAATSTLNEDFEAA